MRNLLFYGYNANLLYQRIHAHIVATYGQLRVSNQSLGASAIQVKTSSCHHEFDCVTCLNSQAVVDMLAMIKDVVRLKRIDAQPHSVVILNIHVLKQTQMQFLKSLINMYSDRTIFLMSTRSVSQLPRGIVFNALNVRCHSPQCQTDLGHFGKKVDDLLDSCIKGSLDMKRARQFAYTCIGFNVSYEFFAKAVIARLADTEHIVAVVAACAENDLLVRKIKKDVMIWEKTFTDIHVIFNR